MIPAGRGFAARATVVLLVAALAIVGASCSGDDDGGGSSDGDASSSSTTSAAPQRGGVLRLGVERPEHLDPALARSAPQSELVVADLLFDGLTAFDPTTGSVVPAIAAEWSSPDQKRWELRLRPDAVFANGRAVTATDVKYTLERVARQGAASAGAVLLETVVGYDDFAVAGSSPELVGVQAPEPALVVIELDAPLSTFPEVLSNPVFGIVPREAVEAPTPAFDSQPVGSGPFAVESRSDEVLTLVRAPQSDAYVDGVEVRLFDDLDASYEQFRDGTIDVTQVPPEAPGGDGGPDVVTTPYQAELFYGMNVDSPKLADARFREAIVRAIDRDAVVDTAYDGVLRPLAAVVPEGVPGAQDDPCGEPCEHDVDAAKALVAQAFPDGNVPEVFVDFDEGGRQEAVATAMKDDLAAVGIPATLRPRPFDDYKSFVASGEQELFRLGWTGGYPSPGAYLAPLFRTDAPDNVMGFTDLEVDRLLDAAAGEADPSARGDLYADAERRVLTAVPIVPVGQFVTRTAVAERVQGLTVSLAGTFDGATVWLSSS